MSKNILKITSEDFNKVIESKDQQIKDLESLIEHAQLVIKLKTDNTTFEDLLSDYKQQYLKS